MGLYIDVWNLPLVETMAESRYQWRVGKFSVPVVVLKSAVSSLSPHGQKNWTTFVGEGIMNSTAALWSRRISVASCARLALIRVASHLKRA